MDEKDMNKEVDATETEQTAEAEESTDSKKKKSTKKLEAELQKLNEQYAELNDRYVRMLAEYDNFRRRSQKERENTYADAYGDAVSEMLPVIDNLERAAQYTDADAVLKGVQMILKSTEDMLTKLGITEIEAKVFDPEYHNAVMHIEDESLGDGEIVEVLQKGYMKGDKVIRYAMVKVAN